MVVDSTDGMRSERDRDGVLGSKVDLKKGILVQRRIVRSYGSTTFLQDTCKVAWEGILRLKVPTAREPPGNTRHRGNWLTA